jgi:2'-deoxynucleoside 5'-phosphate N-hydrolase
MKIYFAGSIRGGREFQKYYSMIISHLKNYGFVLTEHVGDPGLDDSGEENLNDHEIYQRDRDWIIESDVIVAEVTNPSLGVGYELGLGEALKKRILCLLYSGNRNPISAMVAGNSSFQVARYSNEKELEKKIDDFFIDGISSSQNFPH